MLFSLFQALRDSEVIEHAAQNVIMADALRSMRYLALVQKTTVSEVHAVVSLKRKVLS